MKLNRRAAPHIRHQESSRTLMSDVILLLLVLCALGFLYYGPRALMVCAAAVVPAVITDAVCTLLRGRTPNPRDLSPIVTGLIIAMMMPAAVPYYVPAAASVFAITIVKHPFGGTGHNLFNPAAAGFSFAAICWPGLVFMYPMPFDRLPLFGDVTATLYQNPAFVIKLGGIPSNDITSMLLGNYPGPMGATNILVVAACLGYLLFRHTVRWQLPVPFLATCALIAFLFPRVAGDGIQSVIYELMSGAMLFGAVFCITDPVTSPKRDTSLAVYGVFAGAITMLFRYVGGYEESMSFAILFSNAFVSLIDRYNESLHRMVRRKHLEARKSKGGAKTQPLV
ncbi:RnfABCDGE type electron transport complex subunit D [Anaerotruncus colihominis]|uniref:NQR2 and RnfD family protein n=1 Tax=Anaerotruncus colihominis TaxID=169435 RepID=A0A845RD07_9FIRM|nr:RnfABCDGE type electron transport complex subunit D [Anaerotruncus colihominis]NBI78046.1 NQR2 and RnfD family protein [Anaerotruncus colihominis]